MSFSHTASISRPESIALPQAKTIIVGDSTVGKSSIIWKYISEDFRFNMPPTVGLDCNAKTVQLDGKNELKLVIWDTAGQEKYRALITNYFKDANGALIVFDLTVKESFEAVKKVWLEALKKNAPEKICKVILGNKCDRVEDIEVTDEEISAFEKENDLKCFKTSAKENIGICESFFYLAKLMSQTFLFATSIEDKSEETLAVFHKNKCVENKKESIKKTGLVIKKYDDIDKSDQSLPTCCES